MKRMLAAIGLIFALTGCPEEIDFFIAINADDIESRVNEGGVIGIGVSSLESESASLVSGQIPKGMAVEPDGTVQGIPEEAGVFEFTIQTLGPEGESTLQSYILEIQE